MMTITVNGESYTFIEGVTLSDMMDALAIKEKVMAAAVNTIIVKKELWGFQALNEGDVVELLHFVGGG